MEECSTFGDITIGDIAIPPQGVSKLWCTYMDTHYTRVHTVRELPPGGLMGNITLKCTIQAEMQM